MSSIRIGMSAVVSGTTGQSDAQRCIGLGRADWKQQHASNLTHKGKLTQRAHNGAGGRGRVHVGAVAQNGGPALQIDSLGLPARVLEGRAEGPVTHGLGSAAGIGGGGRRRGDRGEGADRRQRAGCAPLESGALLRFSNSPSTQINSRQS